MRNWRVWFREWDGCLRPFYYETVEQIVSVCSMGISAYCIDRLTPDGWRAVDPRTLGNYRLTEVPDVYLKCE